MVYRIAKSIAIFCVLASVASAASADERVDRLPEPYKKWLEEEVVYIITNIERDIFLDLTTIQERDRFIQAFWDRRDPDPATLENEFRVEHYRRIDYANKVLGRDAPKPGWKTDRGKYYIILGEPIEIQRYDGYAEVVSTEIWIYLGDPELGLPARFNLTFFKENDFGEYQLYHPYHDGPQSLLRDPTQYWQVYQHKAVDLLEQVSMDLARASLTIDLTEMTYGFLAARNSIDPLELNVRPSLNLERNLADIETSPMRRVDTNDLEGYKRYGHRVTADYSFRFFDSRSFFAVLYGPGNVPFLHYAFEIEPEDFTMEVDDDGSRHYTTLEVETEVRDKDARPVVFDLNQPLLQMSASQFEKAKRFPVAYRDNLPVLPGEYQISVILKNRATRDYTAAELAMVVPEVEAGRPALSDLVLGYERDESMSGSVTHRTFEIGDIEIFPSIDNTFALNSNAYAFIQTLEVDSRHEVAFSISTDEGVLHEERAKPNGDVVLIDLPLVGLENGFYTVRAELVDEEGTVFATKEAPLSITPRNAVARPAFVYRHSFNVGIPGFLEMTLGNQLMALGRIEEAERTFERAVAADKAGSLPMARWRLASVVLYSRKADRALELLTPLEPSYPNEYEVVEGLAFAHYIKEDYATAKDYFERSAQIRAPDTTALNALGDCYERLGDAEKASELYRRSLELNPNQAGVQARLAGLTGAP